MLFLCFVCWDFANFFTNLVFIIEPIYWKPFSIFITLRAETAPASKEDKLVKSSLFLTLLQKKKKHCSTPLAVLIFCPLCQGAPREDLSCNLLEKQKPKISSKTFGWTELWFYINVAPWTKLLQKFLTKPNWDCWLQIDKDWWRTKFETV